LEFEDFPTINTILKTPLPALPQQKVDWHYQEAAEEVSQILIIKDATGHYPLLKSDLVLHSKN
jgi:hypothetical protein